MEMEFFIHPSEAEGEKWYEYWKEARMQWFYDLGIKKENLKLRDHEKDELAHYAKACVDVEYKCWETTIHGFLQMGQVIPAAEDALIEAAVYMKRRFEG